ncbi:hypothetical protein GJ688_04685 [Heliobacillus mobilis]|uniref:Uncharacterized protein n=1 Tax=Heliobacterium mobile TaxID=28064 RepID=A0A6I3SHE1_HELMO|nr:hypothetical protein [Heliobacterium mobile]MTV48279.1 hypothetical protein [Heliobacterium mobile]
MNCHHGHGKGKATLVLTHIFGGILMAVAISLLFGFFVMVLWNQLMPDIFGLKTITYWQGAGLVILSRLLFGTAGHPKHGHKQKCTHRNVTDQDPCVSHTAEGEPQV